MSTTSMPPGFRFHPTDEELIVHYLRNRAASIPCPASIIAEVDIYKFDPWELPAKSLFGDRELYFFSPRDRKYPNGIRPNRTAVSGYWKATGTDKPVITRKGKENIGVKKSLVFYKGRPPKGVKTDWIMHEYRLADQAHNSNTYKPNKFKDSSMRLDDWVLCRIYNKSNHQGEKSEQEEDSSYVDDIQLITNTPTNISVTTTQETNPLRLPKVCSLTELLEAVDCSALSKLLDNNSPNMIGLENCSSSYTTLNQPLMMNKTTNNIDYNEQLVQQMSQSHMASCLVTENHLKRQWKLEDDTDLSHHAKKPMVPAIFNSYSTKFDGNQFSFISQPVVSHRVFLNSHLG